MNDEVDPALYRKWVDQFAGIPRGAATPPDTSGEELVRELVILAYIVACFAGIGLLAWIA